MDLESRYELLETIGAGSYATVYRARDRELGREVAIKQVHEQYLHNPDQLDRYWKEAQLLASLQHPNIVTIYDIHRDRGWLILELMQANLSDRLAGRQMDLKSLKATLAHCLRALKYLHSRGVLHGDVKPGNIMLDHRKRVKLGDFGLARRASDEEGSLLKGTTKYMAPEVVSEEFGEVGPASDLYSLGFTAYELMCGSENFEQLFPGLSAFGRNKQVAWMMWHAAADRRLPPIARVLQGVPDDLTKVIQRLIEKNQTKRYKSADEALADLNVESRTARETAPLDTPEADEPQTANDPARKKRLLLAAGAFAISLVMCLVVLLLPGPGDTSAPGLQTAGNVAVIRGVDEQARAIKLEDLDSGVLLDDLKLSNGASIYLVTSGQYVELSELKAGDRIEWTRGRSGGGSERLKVEAYRPSISRGIVRSIDRQGREMDVLIEDERGNRSGLRLRIPERTPVLVNGQAVTDRATRLHAINEGDPVVVSHLPETGKTLGRVAERIELRQTQQESGFIVAVQPEQRTLAVRLGRGNLADQITLPVAEDAKLMRGETSVTLAELKLDDAVRVEFDTQFHRVDLLELAGPIAVIDAEPRVLVVNTKDGREAVHVPMSCEIQLGGQSATFEELRRSDEVGIRFQENADGQPVATRVVARRPVQHDRAALLIGTDQTSDPDYPAIPHVVNDLKTLEHRLQTRYAVPQDRMEVLINRPVNELASQIRIWLSKLNASTEVVVYVIGHGVLVEGNVSLAGPNYRASRASQTSLPLDALLTPLRESSASRKLLLLDLSHVAQERQPAATELARSLQARPMPFPVILGSQPDQVGLDWEADHSGAFAHFVTAGYSGAADENHDLRVTVGELAAWLETNMSKVHGANGETQEPLLIEPSR